MAVLPGITLTATLQDFTGANVPLGAINIFLCNFGQNLPRIATTSVLAQVRVRSILQTGITTGIALYGNDQITPQNTYYAISVEDNKKNIVQSGIYQFFGIQTIDLSNAPQLGVQPLPGLPNYAVEQPAGNYPGNTYILSKPSFFPFLISLYYNGNWLRPGVDYTFNQQTRQIHLNFVTQDGDNIYALYISSF
jgi:hypothetical protein